MEKREPFTILIVDDNQNNLMSLRLLIKEHIDANVVEADSGRKALHELLKQQVDLIILDVQMDEMDGFELAHLIKQRKKTRDIPIVFLTAMHTSEAFQRRGFEVGGADYLSKPIDEYQLINRINVYLKLIEKERSMNRILEDRVEEKVRELKIAKEAAEEANAAKSTFLANISHELRTPLNILLSTTQLINLYLREDTVERDKIQSKVNMQVQNCYRLIRLVNNLIDITKIDSDHFKLSPTRCNIVQIVEDIALSVAEYVEDKGIELVFDTEVEEKYLICDLDSIERIVLNLLSNAIKFTPKGGSIFVNLEDFEEGIRLSVRDTGAGIPEDKLNLIFERFKQADNLLTRQREGSGIGLSLVKSLTEMHGGNIKVESEFGSGSTFVVEISECVVEDDGSEILNFTVGGEHVAHKINIEFSDIY